VPPGLAGMGRGKSKKVTELILGPPFPSNILTLITAARGAECIKTIGYG